MYQQGRSLLKTFDKKPFAIVGVNTDANRDRIKEILANTEVIAVDQDPLGMQSRRVRKNGDSEVWAKQMKDGSRAVALLNRGASDTDISVSWEDLGYPAHLSAAVRDLWAKKDVGKSTGTFSAKVPSHGVVMLRVTP